MKFFSDFASCYGISSLKATPVPAEDPTAIIPDPTRSSPARRVNRSSTAAGSSSPSRSRPWRPALGAITENSSAAPAQLLPAAKQDRRKGNKASCSAETRSAGLAKVVTRPAIRSPSHDNSYSGKKSPPIMFAAPGFFPSPLMF